MASLRQLGRGNRSNEASTAKATARRAQTRAFPSLASRSAASAIANSFSICSNLTPFIMGNLRYQVADKKGTVPFLVWPDCLERCSDAGRFASVSEGLMDLDAFRQMVAKNPNGFLGRYGLGNKILQESGNLEEAVEHLRVAVQLDPLHVASHLALARALVALERKEEAKPVLTAGINAAASGRSSGGADLIPEMRALLQTLG